MCISFRENFVTFGRVVNLNKSKMENVYVLYSETLDCSDIPGYVNHSGRQPSNFKNPTKRLFLKECIRQIYVLSGNVMPNIETPAEYNENVIWNTINWLMGPPIMTMQEAMVERVKRRLFRESRKQPRKSKKPKRNQTLFSEFSYFKIERHMWGIKKIPRNFLGRARLFIEMQLRQARKRKYAEIEAQCNHAGSVDLNNSEISQPAIRQLCHYNGNMTHEHQQIEGSMEFQITSERNMGRCCLSRRAYIEEEMLVKHQYTQRLLATEKVLEASVRSILYMKALIQLMVDQPSDDELHA